MEGQEMTRTTIRLLLISGTIAVLLLVGIIAGIAHAAPANAVLDVTVSDPNPQPGDVITVTFTLSAMDAAEEFAEWKVRLGYDASVLTLAGCTANAPVWDSGSGAGVYCVDNPNDVFVGEGNFAGNSTISTPIVLGTVAFTVTSTGASNFTAITTSPVLDTGFLYSGISYWQPGTTNVQQVASRPTVQFSSAAYSVDENAGPAVITATLSVTSTVPVTVTYATVAGGSASPASDYAATTGQLVFASGMDELAFTVAITDDPVDENDETVNLQLSSPQSATLGTPGTAVLTILDDDPQPTVAFDTATQTVDEDVGTVTITATLSAVSGLNVVVPYTVGGTATGGGTDHDLAVGNVNIAAGSLSGTRTFAVNDDALDEDAETVIVTMGTPVNATQGATTVQTITINDNDPLPTVDFESATYNVNEGDGTATITGTLSVPSGKMVTVDYATSDGTAQQPGDYIAVSDTLTFTAGTTVQTFDVTINDDGEDEANETITLTLSSAGNATLGAANNPATLTIYDDEFIQVDFESAAYSVDEITGKATITVTLNMPCVLTVTLDCACSDGTATGGSDYVAASGVLTFTPGITIQTFDVDILGDIQKEGDETAILTLSNPCNAILGPNNPATLTIVDDDHEYLFPIMMRRYSP
jgi:hypothetical protein